MANTPDRHTDSAGKSRTEQVVETAKQAATDARRAVDRAPDTASHTAARTASNIIRPAALEPREAIDATARLVAEAASHAVEASVAEARQVAETSAKVAEAQQSVSHQAGGNAQAVTSSYAQFGQGLLKMQQTYLGMMQEAMERARRQPQQIMSCRTVAELAQVQREIYTDNVGFFMQSGTRMLQMAGDIVKDASRPLERRATRHHG